MTRTRRLGAALAGTLALVVGLSGCGFHGLYSASLPGSVGGAFSGDQTYRVDVYFDNVLDLVPQSAVKVDDVTVGTVKSIVLVPDHGVYRARVACLIKTSVHLPQQTTAVLDETSLLGEKFVALRPPATGGSGSLQTVGHIGPVPGQAQSAQDVAATSAYPTAEDVFGVLSLVLNKGGLGNLQTINSELTQALAGREDKVHDVVGQLNTIVTSLDGVRGQINGAIDALDTLSTTLNQQNATIATALDDIGPGLAVLADERAKLVTLLQSLSSLGVVSHRIIGESLSATKADLALLEPILTELNKAGDGVPGSLQLALDYPFADGSQNSIVGDQNNLVLDLNVTSVVQNLCIPGAPDQVLAACSQFDNLLGSVLQLLGSSPPQLPSSGASLSDMLTNGLTVKGGSA